MLPIGIEHRSMKIGIVDLDTSHPVNWIPIERELGHEVVGLFDSGAVHPPGYAARFAAENGIGQVFESIDEMVEQVDCAIIHGCDWDTHVAKARPFIDAGKAVLVDKPVAGNRRDLMQLKDWAAGGARVTGGSSLRFCDETRTWLKKPAAERGTPHTVLCGCAVDEFNYGIHAFSMLTGIIGAGAQSVRHLGAGPQRRVQIRYADGRSGIVVVGQSAAWLPFYANIVTERSVTQYIADAAKLYRALLEATLPFLAGQTDTPPVSSDEWIEPELCALAALKSWQNGDREVSLSEIGDADAYDGQAFAESYRKGRYPNGWQ
jgi:hypothetical protein